MNAQELTSWILDWMKREMRLTGEIARGENFTRYGMDSVHATMLAGDLEELLARRLPPALAWDYPTPESLGAHLASGAVAAEPASTVPASSVPDDAALLARLNDLSEEELDRLLAERAPAHS